MKRGRPARIPNKRRLRKGRRQRPWRRDVTIAHPFTLTLIETKYATLAALYLGEA